MTKDELKKQREEFKRVQRETRAQLRRASLTQEQREARRRRLRLRGGQVRKAA